ncbi:MAG: HAD family hydrolase [bacterium]|nr:HAD family hydrolase [bacterium]
MEVMNKKRKKVFITDFDNTLYDWLDGWYKAIDKALVLFETKSGLTRDELVPEIRKIHTKYGTTEYENLFHELTCFIPRFKSADEFYAICDEAKKIRNESKFVNLQSYPSVKETLIKIKKAGAKVVVFTESEASSTCGRINALGFNGLIDVVYSADPKNEIFDACGTPYRFFEGVFHPKPCPENLLKIIDEIGVNKEDCVYCGDNMFKDVAMAKSAGVDDIFAKYGSDIFRQKKIERPFLDSITFWSDEMLKKEFLLYQNAPTPSYTLNNSFDEIFNYFVFDEVKSLVK